MPDGYVIPLTWRNRLLVIGGGLALWALPWLAWPRAVNLPVTHPVVQPVFRYVKASSPGLSGAAWSPVLTSLPTPYGFSRKAAAGAETGRNPLAVWKSRVSEPLYLELPMPAVSASVVREASFLQAREFDPDGTGTSVFRPSAAPSATRVEILGELGARQFEAQALQAVVLPVGDAPASAVTAYVELDPKGRVQHVLLEQPSGSAVADSAFVRALRGGGGVPGPGVASGRVRVTTWKSE